jgi:putative hemolysin
VFRDLGLDQAAQLLALGVVVVVLTYLSLVLGELAPKAIALRNPESWPSWWRGRSTPSAASRLVWFGS